jgi:hypothetical protein
MLAFRPHFTIHLGDVYYVGDVSEIDSRCMDMPAESIPRGYSLFVRESWESKNGIPRGAGISMFESELTLVNPDLSAAQR